MGFKWNMLLKIKNIHVSTFESTRIYYISNFLGLFLPPTVGADLVRAFYISKKDYPISDVLASITMERVLGFIVLFISAIIGFFILEITFIKINIDKTKILGILLIVTILGIILFTISLNKHFGKLLRRFSFRFRNRQIFSKVISTFGKFVDSYQGYRHHKVILTLFLLFTFLEIFTVILWSYLTALALNAHVSLGYFIAFTPVVLTFIRLPISLDGFGINEGLFVYFLMLVGISKSLGFSIGFINHLITIIGILPGGVFYALNKIPRKQKIETGIKKEDTL